MKKLKVFDSPTHQALEDAINIWIEHQQNVEILNLEYAIECMSYSKRDRIMCYSALVLYRTTPMPPV